MRYQPSGISMAIYAVILSATIIADIVIQIGLFATGHIAGGVVYLFLGWPITLTIGHWIGMILAAPFSLTGRKRRS